MILYPVYNVWNKLFFDEDIIQCSYKFPNTKHKYVRFKKDFEFRTKLPRGIQSGTKVYVYEPLKHGGCGKVVGEFTVGEIISCDYSFGAYPFIVHFCRNILKNEDYAKKFERAVRTELPGYKQGYIMKYALDDESMDHISKYGTPPDIYDYLYDKQRTANLDDSESVWQWTDEWLRRIGFYNEYGESNYKYAYEVKNAIRYDTPKDLSNFVKESDGVPLTRAPQSFCYVREL